MAERRDGPDDKPRASGLPPPPPAARRPIFQPGAVTAASPDVKPRSIPPPPPGLRPDLARPSSPPPAFARAPEPALAPAPPRSRPDAARAAPLASRTQEARASTPPGAQGARDTKVSGRGESVPGSRPSGVPARIASRGASQQSVVRVDEPSRGAARREGVLLAAYVVLFVIGVWTVVVAELAPQVPDNLHPQTVTVPTQKPQAPGN